MSWSYNVPDTQIKRAPCQKEDCRNYHKYTIVSKRDLIGLLVYRDMNLMVCLGCEHFNKEDNYITNESM